MSYTVMVQKKCGKLPDIVWTTIFERTFDESGLVSVYHVCSVLHALFSTLLHRIVVVSDFEKK